jgi:hypothetical protein
VFDVGDPRHPVTDRVGARRLNDRVDQRVDEFVGADDLDLDLVDEIELVFLAPVNLNVTSGVAETSSLRDGHSGDADVLDSGLHLIELERLDDCGD